ncbi:hypothetical protein KEM54_006930 [Ascosphaera aggregata]|nr:hypothetical protein KEM54_006930 [Ascosphaera aggregata]
MPKVPKETLDASDKAAYSSSYGDLRRAGTQSKRRHDQQSRWALGNRLEYYCYSPMTFETVHENVLAHAARQPRKPHLAMSAEPGFGKLAHHAETVKKRTIRYDIESILEDEFNSGKAITSISDGSSTEVCASDISQLPTASQTILATAIDIAVQKYRDKMAQKEGRELRGSWEFVSLDEDLFGVSDDDLHGEDYLIVSAHDAV